jgi:hypothetical protein
MMKNDFVPNTFLKIFIVAAGLLSAYGIFSNSKELIALDSEVPFLAKSIIAYAIVSGFLRIVAVATMWIGKRGGVYLYAALTVIFCAIGLMTVGPKALLYLVGLVVLYFVVKSQWAQMN